MSSPTAKFVAPNKPQGLDQFKIGNTPILKGQEIDELSCLFGLKRLMVKDESCNEFGTHKDRKSLSIVKKILLERQNDPKDCPEALCIVTAGSAGLSLAYFAKRCNLPVISFINDQGISTPLLKRLQEKCEKVIPIDLSRWRSSEELCYLAGGDQGRRVLDVSGDVTDPYSDIVDEIFEESNQQDWPDSIVVPFGSGELFRGMEKRLRERNLTAQLIGITVNDVPSADKLYINFRQIGVPANLLAFQKPNLILSFDDESLLLKTYEKIKNISGLECEPSSAVAFAALHRLKSEQILRPDDKTMVINTGTFSGQYSPGVE